MQNKAANFLARDFPTNQVLCWQSMRTQNSHWHACMHSFSWKYFPVEGWSRWPKQLLFVWNKLTQWILSSGSLAIISKAFDCFHGNTHCVSCHSNQCRTRIRVVSTVVMWPARFSTGFPTGHKTTSTGQVSVQKKAIWGSPFLYIEHSNKLHCCRTAQIIIFRPRPVIYCLEY